MWRGASTENIELNVDVEVFAQIKCKIKLAFWHFLKCTIVTVDVDKNVAWNVKCLDNLLE